MKKCVYTLYYNIFTDFKSRLTISEQPKLIVIKSHNPHFWEFHRIPLQIQDFIKNVTLLDYTDDDKNHPTDEWISRWIKITFWQQKNDDGTCERKFISQIKLNENKNIYTTQKYCTMKFLRNFIILCVRLGDGFCSVFWRSGVLSHIVTIFFISCFVQTSKTANISKKLFKIKFLFCFIGK